MRNAARCADGGKSGRAAPRQMRTTRSYQFFARRRSRRYARTHNDAIATYKMIDAIAKTNWCLATAQVVQKMPATSMTHAIPTEAHGDGGCRDSRRWSSQTSHFGVLVVATRRQYAASCVRHALLSADPVEFADSPARVAAHIQIDLHGEPARVCARYRRLADGYGAPTGPSPRLAA